MVIEELGETPHCGGGGDILAMTLYRSSSSRAANNDVVPYFVVRVAAVPACQWERRGRIGNSGWAFGRNAWICDYLIDTQTSSALIRWIQIGADDSGEPYR